ncbi:hypothetical protein J2810_001161 [Chryseobacterium rhizosphaerae]|nr:hypothetical protein [Chryseobacterium rhizosphaerae]
MRLMGEVRNTQFLADQVSYARFITIICVISSISERIKNRTSL